MMPRPSRRRHTRLQDDWSSDVCSSDRSEEHTSELQSPCNLYAVFCLDRKSTRLNSSHLVISYAVFCLKKKEDPAQGRMARLPRSIQPALARGRQVLGVFLFFF